MRRSPLLAFAFTLVACRGQARFTAAQVLGGQEVSAAELNEGHDAKQIAQAIGTTHHEILLTESMFVDNIDHALDTPVCDEVLLNLRPEWPPFFGRFERLVEIVSAGDEDDKRLARERFKFYRDRGYEIRTHDLGNGAASA